MSRICHAEPKLKLRLAEMLEEREWTAYKLAKESGIPQPTVYRLLETDAKDQRISLRTLGRAGSDARRRGRRVAEVHRREAGEGK